MNIPETSLLPFQLSRRQALLGLAAGCAGLLSPSLLATGVSGYGAREDLAAQGRILNREQMRELAAMVEVIIPATETLGAAGTDTHGFIDDQLASCRAPEEAKQYIALFDTIRSAVRESEGKSYSNLAAGRQIEIMHKLAIGEAPYGEAGADFFKKLKAMTLIGYYGSQEGGSRELVYLPIPGGFDADVSVADNGGKAYMPFHI